MTGKINDGGPAFARPFSERKAAFPADHEEYNRGQVGMTLRDYFAAKALPFCLSEFGGNAEDQRQYAEAAYQIADSMLIERSKK